MLELNAESFARSWALKAPLLFVASFALDNCTLGSVIFDCVGPALAENRSFRHLSFAAIALLRGGCALFDCVGPALAGNGSLRYTSFAAKARSYVGNGCHWIV
ncbi:hypothetical protein [Shewanella sediminis]|uniref:hypothetical protein n=1 Tax=Shewanella sediminis TaxID=271097 RepID=UPI00059B9148|nr:hypothetical protein [Shewanella sediminis]